jgi:AraC-like DNA-binding protein
MEFNLHTIPASLAPHIESIFHFRDFVSDHTIERVVPSGHIFLIIELDGFIRHVYDNETLQPFADYRCAWVSGIHHNYLSISVHQHSELFVVQFSAAGAYPFLHVRCEDITERVVQADEIFGAEIVELRKQLLAAPESTEKFDIAEQWLLRRFNEDKTPPDELLEMVQQLQNEPAAKLNDILETYPKTQKHLIDQFKKYVGLTPKYYQRILRFSEILQKIQHKETIAWTDIAYSCGYADQSHFIKEFQHFSGFNPSEFISLEHQKKPVNFFPLN